MSENQNGNGHKPAPFGYNRVIVYGRLGRDPDLKQTTNGTSVCNFSLATTTTRGEDDEKKEVTEWHQITCWGKTAENAAKFLKKGRTCLIEGRLQTDEYKKMYKYNPDDKNEQGMVVTHRKTSIHVDRIQYGDSPKEDTTGLKVEQAEIPHDENEKTSEAEQV